MGGGEETMSLECQAEGKCNFVFRINLSCLDLFGTVALLLIYLAYIPPFRKCNQSDHFTCLVLIDKTKRNDITSGLFALTFSYFG